MAGFITRPLKRGLMFGKRLRRARTAKKITLEQAEQDTFIRAQFLQAFEDGRFEVLPQNVYATSFLTRYARYLGLKPELLVAQFKAERALVDRTEYSVLVPASSLREHKFLLTPKLVAGVLVAVVIVGIFGYVGWAVQRFTDKPALTMKTPSELITTEKTILVQGATDEAATVTINDQPIHLQQDGTFQEDVALHPGVNVVEIIATNRTKKETHKTLTIWAPQS